MKLHVSPRSVGARRGGSVSAGLAAVAVAAALGTLAPPAHAQEVVVVNQGDSRGEYRGPNWMLLSTGLVIFSGTYTASFAVAASSNHAGDSALYAPLVGPWFDIANRCPAGCNDDVGRKVLLGFDGVFQAVGLLSIASSFFLPSRRSRGLADAPTFRVLPASLGRGAPGLTAVGTF